jgi:basic membrane protein A
VTDTGGIDDHGLNQGAWEGLQDALKEQMIQHADYIESSDSRDYSKNIEYFTDREFDIIVTVGASQQQETQLAADENATIHFVGIDQRYTIDFGNLHSINFQDAQMGFFAGALASMFTRTGRVGAVCETSDIDSIRQKCEGFRLGATSCGETCNLRADQTIDVMVRYREDDDPELFFNDQEWGEQTAKSLIHRGVDILYAVGGGTAQAAIRAAAASRVYAIGAEKDQWFALPEARGYLITSIYGDSRRAVRDWLSLMDSGQPPTSLGAPFVYAPFRDFESSRSLDMEHMITRLLLDIENETVTVPDFP